MGAFTRSYRGEVTVACRQTSKSLYQVYQVSKQNINSLFELCSGCSITAVRYLGVVVTRVQFPAPRPTKTYHHYIIKA